MGSKGLHRATSILKPSPTQLNENASSLSQARVRFKENIWHEEQKIPVNLQGGYFISREEIELAAQFFDANRSRTSEKGYLQHNDQTKDHQTKTTPINPASLSQALRKINLDISEAELKVLFQGEKDLSAEKLTQLLYENEISNFDPVKEAFRYFDPENTGTISVTTLKEIMRALLGREMTQEDVNVMLDTAGVINEKLFSSMQPFSSVDFSHPPGVNFSQFRRMLDSKIPSPPTPPESDDEDSPKIHFGKSPRRTDHAPLEAPRKNSFTTPRIQPRTPTSQLQRSLTDSGPLVSIHSRYSTGSLPSRPATRPKSKERSESCSPPKTGGLESLSEMSFKKKTFNKL